jgi:hypothetical protein
MFSSLKKLLNKKDFFCFSQSLSDKISAYLFETCLSKAVLDTELFCRPNVDFLKVLK